MPPLAETQAQIRKAIVDRDAVAILFLLAAGVDPVRRLAIYQRHYDASLVKHILGRFPTVVWLAGSAFVTEAAHRFVRRYPPAAPCMAEYGQHFPAFLAGEHAAARLPYLCSAGEIDWRLGEVAVAIEYPAIEISMLADFDAEILLDLRLGLQPGLGYLQASWPVDDLVRLHLGERTPERYVLDPLEVHLEIRGARSGFRISRLDLGTFTFRRALSEGIAIAAAVENAQQADPAFDAALALAPLFAEGLVTSATVSN